MQKSNSDIILPNVSTWKVWQPGLAAHLDFLYSYWWTVSTCLTCPGLLFSSGMNLCSCRVCGSVLGAEAAQLESQRGAAGLQSHSDSSGLETGICLSFTEAQFAAHQNGFGGSQVEELPGEPRWKRAEGQPWWASPGLREVSAPGRFGLMLTLAHNFTYGC